MYSQIERICLSANSECNLGCKYCYFFAIPDALPGPEALTSDEIRTILDNIHRYSLRPECVKRIKVNFVGSGEPMLSWKQIRTAIEGFQADTPEHRLRFYMVTNGTLLNKRVVGELKALNFTPSVSLDGPRELHDRNRIYHRGIGSFDMVMRGIELLREAGFVVAINTVLTHDLINNLEAYFAFVAEKGFQKIIFDRLVDVPEDVPALNYDEFYRALRRIGEMKVALELDDLEIGNLEAYRRAVGGNPDRVCTMFGSTCGAGFNNVIYMQRDVYPCGRMFHLDHWKLGRFDDPLEFFPDRMTGLLQRSRAGAYTDEGSCGRDCIMEQERPDYESTARQDFIRWFSAWERAGIGGV